MTQTTTPRFEDLGIAESLLTILQEKGYTTPTPIQHQSIPIGLTGADVMGIAQTGTGKTLAFGIPMIQRLGTTKGRGLVILPTRELALQVDETFKKIGQKLGLRTVVLIGGENIQKQNRALSAKPHIIIATPGRLIDHMKQRTVNLSDIKILVLDEADRMFDMGFAPQLKQILGSLPKERQTMLYSATMPPEIVKIATLSMKMPIRVEVAPAGTSAEKVEQEMILVRKEDKQRLLEKLLQENKGTVLVFSRTKHGAKRISKKLTADGFSSAEIHSDRSLSQRIKALDGFKSGKIRVLIATDIAARGIDVKDIELVINYDLPDQTEDYVHRIGRTGRAGSTGKAISFATPDQKGDIKNIERLIRKPLKMVPLPELPPQKFEPRPVFQNSSREDFRNERGAGTPDSRNNPFQTRTTPQSRPGQRTQSPRQTGNARGQSPKSEQGQAPGGRPQSYFQKSRSKYKRY
jgi:ATP-dependent RNA helicase RhlE